MSPKWNTSYKFDLSTHQFAGGSSLYLMHPSELYLKHSTQHMENSSSVQSSEAQNAE